MDEIIIIKLITFIRHLTDKKEKNRDFSRFFYENQIRKLIEFILYQLLSSSGYYLTTDRKLIDLLQWKTGIPQPC
jgi:hypothetical protein